MNKIVLGIFAALVAIACNNAGNSTNTPDSSAAKKDNTNMYDTGVGSSMTDTSHRRDTSTMLNKIQDTSTKK